MSGISGAYLPLAGGTLKGDLTTTGNLNATGNIEKGGTVLPIQKVAVLPDQAITSAGGLTLAHGLGVKPKLVTLDLVCVTAQANFAPGDVTPPTNVDAGEGWSLFSLDATNVAIRFGNGGSCFGVIDKNTGTQTGIAVSNWKARITCYG